MGISVGKKNFVFSNLFVHDTPAVNLSQVAEHYADTQILPVVLFSNLLGITLNHAVSHFIVIFIFISIFVFQFLFLFSISQRKVRSLNRSLKDATLA